MAEIYCPYCNGRNVLKISYAYRGVNKKKNKKIDYSKYLKEGTIFMPKVRFEKYDFDGEKIKYAKLDNRYCVDCDKKFCSIRNLATVDIRRITLVIETKTSRKKYIFDLYNEPTYIYIKNYILVKKEIIDDSVVYELLSAIKNNKVNLWAGHYGYWENFNNIKWILKLEYYNGITDCKSGCDSFPDNWDVFIGMILKKFIIKLD